MRELIIKNIEDLIKKSDGEFEIVQPIHENTDEELIDIFKFIIRYYSKEVFKPI